jgi:hypothetical protein
LNNSNTTNTQCPICTVTIWRKIGWDRRQGSLAGEGACRVITPDEIEQIHKQVLKFERIEAVFGPMRELIEDLWPELVRKLPPKR